MMPRVLFFYLLGIFSLIMDASGQPVDRNFLLPADSLSSSFQEVSTGNFRLDALIEGQTLQNLQKNQGVISGYRIRIVSFSGSTARQRTLDARARFQKDFPGIPTYWIYTEPDYKVYVGDYRTKTDAYRDLVMIRRQFTSAFIISDQIALPAL